MVSRISPTPKRPITAIRKSKPRSSSIVPKVIRRLPVTLSIPTAASEKPSIIAASTLKGDSSSHSDEAAEGQELHREELRRPELQGEAGDDRRQEGQHDDGKEGADEGRREGGRERLVGLALLGHGMAVESGRDRPWLAGNIEQDRGDGAAEKRAPIDRRQHDDRRRRRHREGERQEDGDAVGAAEAGKHADQHAERDADAHVGDVHRVGEDAEAKDQGAEGIRDHELSACPMAECAGLGARRFEVAASHPVGAVKRCAGTGSVRASFASKGESGAG